MSESSPAACRFAIRDRTVFWPLLAGLLNIDSALTLISFARRDDADGFLFVIFILHTIHVDDQEHGTRHGWIHENERRTLESDAIVLLLIEAVLFSVPFKPHRYTNCITYRGKRRPTREPWGSSGPIPAQPEHARASSET